MAKLTTEFGDLAWAIRSKVYYKQLIVWPVPFGAGFFYALVKKTKLNLKNGNYNLSQ